MSKIRNVLVGVIAGALLAGGGAAAAWWSLRASQADEATLLREQAHRHPPRYVSPEEGIVMLRREPGDPRSHYTAVDLVFKTVEKWERVTREHLPMLRSVAVRALSTLTPEKARAMSVDDLAAEIGRAYFESYAAENREKPFTEVMIGKLIIE